MQFPKLIIFGLFPILLSIVYKIEKQKAWGIFYICNKIDKRYVSYFISYFFINLAVRQGFNWAIYWICFIYHLKFGIFLANNDMKNFNRAAVTVKDMKQNPLTIYSK